MNMNRRVFLISGTVAAAILALGIFVYISTDSQPQQPRNSTPVSESRDTPELEETDQNEPHEPDEIPDESVEEGTHESSGDTTGRGEKTESEDISEKQKERVEKILSYDGDIDYGKEVPLPVAKYFMEKMEERYFSRFEQEEDPDVGVFSTGNMLDKFLEWSWNGEGEGEQYFREELKKLFRHPEPEVREAAYFAFLSEGRIDLLGREFIQSLYEEDNFEVLRRTFQYFSAMNWESRNNTPVLSRWAEESVDREINPRVHRAFINDMIRVLDFHIYNASPKKNQDSRFGDNKTILQGYKDKIERKISEIENPEQERNFPNFPSDD